MAEEEEEDLRGGCQKCGSLSFCQEWFDVFRVILCNSCRRDEELITKSAAKEIYMLTEGDLKKLGSISRSNPHKKDWSAMRLYMQSQCEKMALGKYGDEEGIEEHRRNLLDVRQERRAQKRLSNQKQEERQQALHDRVRQKLDESVKFAQRQSKGEHVDAETGAVKRVYDDGVEADVEDI